MTDIRIGALWWNQYTEWPARLEAGVRADAVGYDGLRTWDLMELRAPEASHGR